MIVKPHLLVQFRSVVSFDVVELNDLLILLSSDNYVCFLLFFIKKYIGVGTRPHTSPFVAYIVATVAFRLHAGMWEDHYSGIVKLDPT